jgi:flagellar biosynthesis protein FlhB
LSDASRTEQATPRRRQKARERGQVARSREISSALALLCILVFLWAGPNNFRGDWRMLFAGLLDLSVRSDLRNTTSILASTGRLVCSWTAPAVLLGWLVAVLASIAQGGFVFAPEALAPKAEKLSPASNLKRVFSIASLRPLLKSLVPAAFLLYITGIVLFRERMHLVESERLAPRASMRWLLEVGFEICWKSALLFVIWSALDYLLEWVQFEMQLRMSREEIKEEYKETEGHPTIKARIRQIQRQLRNRHMLRDVSKATVVITNPTEFAVALAYIPGETDVPTVVAKGRNLLAQRIRKEASWHGIPIIENPPLAQALYRAVQVGQAIPAKLYTAVAEILAFIYRLRAQPSAAFRTPRAAGFTARS